MAHYLWECVLVYGNIRLLLCSSHITVTILDIIHRTVPYLKHDVSETGFYLGFQMEPTQSGPIDRTSLCLRTDVCKRIKRVTSIVRYSDVLS
jgi:hypothetical protein